MMPKYKVKYKQGGKDYIATVKAPNKEAAEKAVREGKSNGNE
jgi:hypothetical protein